MSIVSGLRQRFETHFHRGGTTQPPASDRVERSEPSTVAEQQRRLEQEARTQRLQADWADAVNDGSTRGALGFGLVALGALGACLATGGAALPLVIAIGAGVGLGGSVGVNLASLASGGHHENKANRLEAQARELSQQES